MQQRNVVCLSPHLSIGLNDTNKMLKISLKNRKVYFLALSKDKNTCVFFSRNGIKSCEKTRFFLKNGGV